MKILLDLPEAAFSSLRQAPEAFATAMRVAACVKWYELGRLSQGKAAELAGLSREQFVAALREHKVAAVQTEPDELQGELTR